MSDDLMSQKSLPKRQRSENNLLRRDRVSFINQDTASSAVRRVISTQHDDDYGDRTLTPLASSLTFNAFFPTIDGFVPDVDTTMVHKTISSATAETAVPVNDDAIGRLARAQSGLHTAATQEVVYFRGKELSRELLAPQGSPMILRAPSNAAITDTSAFLQFAKQKKDAEEMKYLRDHWLQQTHDRPHLVVKASHKVGTLAGSSLTVNYKLRHFHASLSPAMRAAVVDHRIKAAAEREEKLRRIQDDQGCDELEREVLKEYTVTEALKKKKTTVTLFNEELKQRDRLVLKLRTAKRKEMSDTSKQLRLEANNITNSPLRGTSPVFAEIARQSQRHTAISLLSPPPLPVASQTVNPIPSPDRLSFAAPSTVTVRGGGASTTTHPSEMGDTSVIEIITPMGGRSHRNPLLPSSLPPSGTEGMPVVPQMSFQHQLEAQRERMRDIKNRIEEREQLLREMEEEEHYEMQASAHGVDVELLKDIKVAFQLSALELEKYRSDITHEDKKPRRLNQGNGKNARTVGPADDMADWAGGHKILEKIRVQSNAAGVGEEEFIELFGPSLCKGMSADEIRHWFRFMDRDCSGSIQWGEVSQYMTEVTDEESATTTTTPSTTDSSSTPNHIDEQKEGGSSNTDKDRDDLDEVNKPTALPKTNRRDRSYFSEVMVESTEGGHGKRGRRHRHVISRFVATTGSRCVDRIYSMSEDEFVFCWDPVTLHGTIVHRCAPGVHPISLVYVPQTDKLIILQNDRSILFYDVRIVRGSVIHERNKVYATQGRNVRTGSDGLAYYLGAGDSHAPSVGATAAIQHHTDADRREVPAMLLEGSHDTIMSIEHLGSGGNSVDTVVCGMESGNLEVYHLHNLNTARHTPIQPSSVYPSHTSFVTHLKYAADLNAVVSSSLDGSVAVTDVLSGVVVQRMKLGDSSTSPVFGFSYSPPQNILITWGGRRMHLWNALTGAKLISLSEHDSPVRHVAVNSQMQHAYALLESGTVKVWDMKSWKAIGRVEDKLPRFPSNHFEALHWCPNHHVLFCGAADIFGWRPEDVNERDEAGLPGAQGVFLGNLLPIQELKVLESAGHIVAMDMNTVTVWSISDKKLLSSWEWEDEDDLLTCLCSSPDEVKLLIGTERGNLAWYNYTNGCKFFEFKVQDPTEQDLVIHEGADPLPLLKPGASSRKRKERQLQKLKDKIGCKSATDKGSVLNPLDEDAVRRARLGLPPAGPKGLAKTTPPFLLDDIDHTIQTGSPQTTARSNSITDIFRDNNPLSTKDATASGMAIGAVVALSTSDEKLVVVIASQRNSLYSWSDIKGEESGSAVPVAKYEHAPMTTAVSICKVDEDRQTIAAGFSDGNVVILSYGVSPLLAIDAKLPPERLCSIGKCVFAGGFPDGTLRFFAMNADSYDTRLICSIPASTSEEESITCLTTNPHSSTVLVGDASGAISIFSCPTLFDPDAVETELLPSLFALGSRSVMADVARFRDALGDVELVLALDAHNGGISGLHASSADVIITTGGDRCIRQWSVAEREQVFEFGMQYAAQNSIEVILRQRYDEASDRDPLQSIPGDANTPTSQNLAHETSSMFLSSSINLGVAIEEEHQRAQRYQFDPDITSVHDFDLVENGWDANVAPIIQRVIKALKKRRNSHAATLLRRHIPLEGGDAIPSPTSASVSDGGSEIPTSDEDDDCDSEDDDDPTESHAKLTRLVEKKIRALTGIIPLNVIAAIRAKIYSQYLLEDDDGDDDSGSKGGGSVTGHHISARYGEGGSVSYYGDDLVLNRVSTRALLFASNPCSPRGSKPLSRSSSSSQLVRGGANSSHQASPREHPAKRGISGPRRRTLTTVESEKAEVKKSAKLAAATLLGRNTCGYMDIENEVHAAFNSAVELSSISPSFPTTSQHGVDSKISSTTSKRRIIKKNDTCSSNSSATTSVTFNTRGQKASVEIYATRKQLATQLHNEILNVDKLRQQAASRSQFQEEHEGGLISPEDTTRNTLKASMSVTQRPTLQRKRSVVLLDGRGDEVGTSSRGGGLGVLSNTSFGSRKENSSSMVMSSSSRNELVFNASGTHVGETPLSTASDGVVSGSFRSVDRMKKASASLLSILKGDTISGSNIVKLDRMKRPVDSGDDDEKVGSRTLIRSFTKFSFQALKLRQLIASEMQKNQEEHSPHASESHHHQLQRSALSNSGLPPRSPHKSALSSTSRGPPAIHLTPDCSPQAPRPINITASSTGGFLNNSTNTDSPPEHALDNNESFVLQNSGLFGSFSIANIVEEDDDAGGRSFPSSSNPNSSRPQTNNRSNTNKFNTPPNTFNNNSSATNHPLCNSSSNSHFGDGDAMGTGLGRLAKAASQMRLRGILLRKNAKGREKPTSSANFNLYTGGDGGDSSYGDDALSSSQIGSPIIPPMRGDGTVTTNGTFQTHQPPLGPFPSLLSPTSDTTNPRTNKSPLPFNRLMPHKRNPSSPLHQTQSPSSRSPATTPQAPRRLSTLIAGADLLYEEDAAPSTQPTFEASNSSTPRVSVLQLPPQRSKRITPPPLLDPVPAPSSGVLDVELKTDCSAPFASTAIHASSSLNLGSHSELPDMLERPHSHHGLGMSTTSAPPLPGSRVSTPLLSRRSLLHSGGGPRPSSGIQFSRVPLASDSTAAESGLPPRPTATTGTPLIMNFTNQDAEEQWETVDAATAPKEFDDEQDDADFPTTFRSAFGGSSSPLNSNREERGGRGEESVEEPKTKVCNFLTAFGSENFIHSNSVLSGSSTDRPPRPRRVSLISGLPPLGGGKVGPLRRGSLRSNRCGVGSVGGDADASSQSDLTSKSVSGQDGQSRLSLPALPSSAPARSAAASSSSVVLRDARSRNQSYCDTIAKEIAVAQAAAVAAQRLAASKKKRHNVVTINVPPGGDGSLLTENLSAEERSERRAAELRQALQHNTAMFTKATDRVVSLLPPLQSVRMRPQESNVEALLLEVSEVKATRDAKQLGDDPTQWDGARPYSCLPMNPLHCFPRQSNGHRPSSPNHRQSAVSNVLSQRKKHQGGSQVGTLEQIELREVKLRDKSDYNGLGDEGHGDVGSSSPIGANTHDSGDTAGGSSAVGATRSWQWAVQTLPNQRRFLSLFGRVGGVQSTLDFSAKNQGRSLPFASVPELSETVAPHADAGVIKAPPVYMSASKF